MVHPLRIVPPVRAILFDLDGTLVDSAPDLCQTMNHVLAARGYPLLDLGQVRHLVGHGARALLARGFWGETAEPPVADPWFEEAVVAFLDYYRDHLTDQSVPYPGAVAALHTLRDRGLALAVVTNKPEALAQCMLEQLQLRSFFTHVVGGDTLPQRKPAAEPLLYVLDQLHIPPHQAVMVGDSETDLLAARAAGCPVVLMRHGYSRGMDLEQLRPDGVLDHFAQLSPLCAG
ncbi:MAG: phosphoglycolate phosphatase [Magnetococcales bacterium]|nr:phosphoglycolate phosphatase [Magnetococcales bacterium]